MTSDPLSPDDGRRSCQDCGRPFTGTLERDSAGQPFRVCQPCYDVYVDTAGHWPVHAAPPASES